MNRPSPHAWWVANLLCLVLTGLCLLTGQGCSSSSDPGNVATSAPVTVPEQLNEAARLARVGKSDEAMKIVQAVLIADPDQIDAMSIAIEIHSQRGELGSAAELAERVALLRPQNAGFILVKAFDWRLRAGDHQKAEANLLQAIELQSDPTQLQRTMAQFLNAQGRRFEASEYLRALVQADVNSPEELLGLIDISGPFSLVSFDEVVDRSQVNLFMIRDARDAFLSRSDPEKGLEILDPVVERFPDVPAAVALRGRILADLGDLEALKAWAKNLPAGIDRHPEYWFALGSWLSQTDNHEQAVRAFGEAIRRDPTDRHSLRQLIASLERLNQIKMALKLRPRLAMLDEIFRNALHADPEQCRVIAKQLDQMVRPWEATGWLKLAAHKENKLREKSTEIANRRRSVMAWQQKAGAEKVPDLRLKNLLGFELDSWPLPKIDSVISASPLEAVAAASTEMRMVDVAQSVGIDTTFVSGLPAADKPYYLYQINGGGLAAFDYDLDGRCDVYVVQSGGKPLVAKSTPNQMFRQIPGERFVDVSADTASDGRGFGQGVCAGDINQDGFLDLVVANIGKNAIFLNQGDGTFREASDALTENPADWTSSVAIADLDGDHLPEYVAANYIDDPTIYVDQCEGGWLSGGRMDCVPQQHQAANDRVLRNRGDGIFEAWKEVDGIDQKPNFGFGILIANIDRKNGNDLFITNDGDLNHYWSSQSGDDNERRYSMAESAGVLGCSIGANGQSQACMGLGAGDYDRNGCIDFHVTNFYNQSSNLYMQNESGFFVDDALKYGLKPITYKQVGFGTQAIDIDNDGWQDMAVLNGHVHDDRKIDIPFQMESQVFRGGPDRFLQQSPEQLGEYWSGKYLGRTLAKLDWNGDGRIDLLANHLDAPVALIENRSSGGNWIQLELIGTKSERDAIGAQVTVTANGQTWTEWETGGDGYMCTNEPIIHIGLGNAKTVDKIEVLWPTGETQTFSDLNTGHRYLIIENQSDPFDRAD